MLGYESERRLKNLLLAVSDGELLLERSRQRLCEIRDFAPLAAFHRLDRDVNDFLTSFEILSFLRDNRVYDASESECYRLVKFFDSDEDGRLSFNDFIQMLLPCEDNLLRNIAMDRPSQRVGRFDFLPRDIESALTDILEKELDLQRRLSILKREVEIRYDYSTYACYRSIDRYNDGFIDTYNLGQFLKNNGHYASERELLAIIRRIDTDGDAKLSYVEYSDFLSATSVPSAVVSQLEESLRAKSEEKNRRRNLNASSYNSPAKSNYNQQSSPVRAHSAAHNASRAVRFNVSSSSPLRESSPLRNDPQASRISPLKESLRESSPVRRQLPLRLEVEDELVRALREQISLERELENAKILLVQTPDFNIFDAFRIFDMDSRGWISLADLKIGLNEIGVYPDTEELTLFFKRYDNDQDGRIRFSEFSDAFTPLDNYYSQLLNRRSSNDIRGRYYSRDDCFINQTKVEFKNVWRTHLKVEAFSEGLRQRLYKRPGFNIYEAFNSCDLKDDGMISRDELRRLIESRGFYVSEQEVSQLVEKIDKDKDGKISYQEFREEFLPRSPSYDITSIPEAPTFQPTEEEFQNFSACLEKYEKLAGTSGIFKIVPPKGYVARKAGYDDLLFTVKKPIEQNVHGNKGLYELVYFIKESKSLQKFKKQAQDLDKMTNSKSDEDIERLFWKTLKHSAPVYGADVLGSLFDSQNPWNLSEIDTILKHGLGDQQIQGVNTPYVYVGSWKTMFGWHKEDMDLYSINYLHYGKPKFWYGIDLDSNERFENFAKQKFPEYSKECSEFIRHKTTLIYPGLLLEHGIKLTKLTHKEGEFMISRAAAYHSGFNSGFNIAEAVNFALPRWLELAQDVKCCKCVGDSVRINMGNFLQNMLTQENIQKIKKKVNLPKLLQNSQIDQIQGVHFFSQSNKGTPSLLKPSPLNIKVTPSKRQVMSQPLEQLQQPEIIAPRSRSNSQNIQPIAKPIKQKHKKIHVVCKLCQHRRKVLVEELHSKNYNQNFTCDMVGKKNIKCKSQKEKSKRKSKQQQKDFKDQEHLISTQRKRKIQPSTPRQKQSSTVANISNKRQKK